VEEKALGLQVITLSISAVVSIAIHNDIMSGVEVRFLVKIQCGIHDDILLVRFRCVMTTIFHECP